MPRISTQQMENAYTSIAGVSFVAPFRSSGACQRSVPSKWIFDSRTEKRRGKQHTGGDRLPALPRRLQLHFALPEIRNDAPPFVIDQHIRSLHIQKLRLERPNEISAVTFKSPCSTFSSCKYTIPLEMWCMHRRRSTSPLAPALGGFNVLTAPESSTFLFLNHLTRLPPSQYSLTINQGRSPCALLAPHIFNTLSCLRFLHISTSFLNRDLVV